MDFQKLFKIIETYNGLPADFADIDRLINARKKLACLSINLAELTGDLRTEFESNYYQRKLNFAKGVMKHKEGKTVSEAEALALIDVEEFYKQEKLSDAEYQKCRLILNQVNEVLSSMNGHLSYLKDEKKRINVTQAI